LRIGLQQELQLGVALSLFMFYIINSRINKVLFTSVSYLKALSIVGLAIVGCCNTQYGQVNFDCDKYQADIQRLVYYLFF
jgi:hypothetical protein